MKWIVGPIGEYKDTPKVDAFLDEVSAVCIKHGLVLEVEGVSDGFVVYTFERQSDLKSLECAHVSISAFERERSQ